MRPDRPGLGGRPDRAKRRHRGPVPQTRPVIKEHPQYGRNIPPEELEFLMQHRPAERRPPRVGGPAYPPHRPSGSGRPLGRGRPERAPGRPGPTGPAPRHPRPPHRTGVPSAGQGPPRPVPAPEEPPLGRLRRIVNGYQASAAVLAGYSLGLFAEIHRLPQVATDLARHLGADPRGVERLLNALTALGIVHRHGSTYVLPRELAPYLVPGADDDATGWTEQAIDFYRAWGDLARGIRDGTPQYPLSTEAILQSDPQRVRRYIRSVHTMSREAARRLMELAPLPQGSSLVDVGCGSGIIAARYARETPGLKATLFDLAPTLEVAREILTAEGLEDLVEFHPGDYRHDAFPGPVDAVLLSNVLQTEGEEQARRLIAKAREALRVGGTLLIHGILVDADGVRPTDAALFSLLMYVVFDGGRAYSLDEIGGWLTQEGFGVRSVRPLGAPFPSTLIIASRLE